MPCDDRPNHAPGNGAGQRCTKVTRPCQHIQHAGDDIRVCLNCATRTIQRPFITNELNNIKALSPSPGVPPAAPPGPNNRSPWPGFLTRLCTACEYREIKLMEVRQSGPPVPAGCAAADLFPEEDRILHEDAPRRTCTCERKLSQQSRTTDNPSYRHCAPCRINTWREMLERKRANVSGAGANGKTA